MILGDIDASHTIQDNVTPEAIQYHIQAVHTVLIIQAGFQSERLLQAIAAFKFIQDNSSSFSNISFLKAVLFLRV
jgi:hypothetical protein